MGKKIDLMGNRYGRLVVIGEASRGKDNSARWVCKCDCGNVTNPIRATELNRGRTKSCGCFKVERIKEANTRHGDGHSRLNTVWINMKQRCYNAKRAEFKHYGGRGIKVCAEWVDDFEAFRDWAMSSGYDPDAPRGKCTLDRINVDGDYCPENCRWTTQKEQCNNLRKNLVVTINGKSQTVKQWAEEAGMDEAKIRYRLKHGYTGDVLLTKNRVAQNTK